MKENCLLCEKFPVCREVDQVVRKIKFKSNWEKDVVTLFEKEARFCDYYEYRKSNLFSDNS